MSVTTSFQFGKLLLHLHYPPKERKLQVGATFNYHWQVRLGTGATKSVSDWGAGSSILEAQ